MDKGIGESVEMALQRGDLAILKALQIKLARMIDASKSGRDIAALSRQLREVSEEIEQREEAGQGSDLIEAMRRKHAGSPTVAARTRRGVKEANE